MIRLTKANPVNKHNIHQKGKVREHFCFTRFCEPQDVEITLLAVSLIPDNDITAMGFCILLSDMEYNRPHVHTCCHYSFLSDSNCVSLYYHNYEV